LPDFYRELSEIEFAIATKSAVTLPPQTATALASMESCSEEVRVFRLKLDAYVQLDSSVEDARWLLAHSENSEAAVTAVSIAIGRSVQTDIHAALGHKFASVVARALSSVASAHTAP